MRHVHLDMIGGLAGDIFLAASIDAGLITAEELQDNLRLVGLGPVEVLTERVTRCGITSTHLNFGGWDPEHERDHRHLTEIEAMLTASDLDPGTKERAISMFRDLGKAESEIHGISMDHVHFHEVGAVDSILDFVGAALVLERPHAPAHPTGGSPSTTQAPEVGAALNPNEIQSIMSQAGAGCPLGPCAGCPHHEVTTGACKA